MKNGFLGKAFGGLVLIAIGVMFFLNQLDIVQFDLGYVISHFWPVVLIIIGLRGLTAAQSFRHGHIGSFLWGVVMIALGLVFLNKNFNWIPEFGVSELFKFAVPAVLIILGIRLLFRPRAPGTPPEPEPYTPKDWQPYSSSTAGLDGTEPTQPDTSSPDRAEGMAGPSTAPPASEQGRPAHMESWHTAKQQWKQSKHEWRDEIRQRKREWKQDWKHWKHDGDRSDGGGCYANGADNRNGFIGDVRIGREYWELKPLNISHFVGDTEIDLTRASIPYGETTINISAFVGDVKIFVPNDLQLEISVRASAFLGDMSVFDKWEGGLFRNMNAESPHYFEAEKRIKIIVNAFIGDVRVKRVG